MEDNVLQLDVSFDILGDSSLVHQRVDVGHIVDHVEDLCAGAAGRAEHLHQSRRDTEVGRTRHHTEEYLGMI